MKKTKPKKLAVSPQTLRNLSPAQLTGVVGGEILKTVVQISRVGNCGVGTGKT